MSLSLNSPTELTCELVRIPSVNPMGQSVEGEIYFEHRMTDWLCRFFESFEAPYRLIKVAPDRQNVVAQFVNPKSEATLLLDAHQDTVPVAGMTIEPFAPVVANGRISGRGSVDVKGGMAAMLHAFRRLFLERPETAPNVLMSCTCDEESTATGIQALVRHWTGKDTDGGKELPRPDAAIVAEPTGLNVVVAHRGVVRCKVRTRGRACHSSQPDLGENAIYKMARVLQWFETYADRLARELAPHPLVGSPTLSVGRISGGSSVNIVPDECTIEVDRRLVPGESPESAALQMEQTLQEDLDSIAEFETPWLKCPPLSDDSNHWLAERTLQAIAPVCGERKRIGVPFGTNASFTCAAKIPSVVFGPGSIEQAHTKDEFIDIQQLDEAAEIYYRLISEWLKDRTTVDRSG